MLLCVWGLVEQTTKTPSAGGVGHLLGQHPLPWIESGPTGLPGTRPPPQSKQTTQQCPPDLSPGLALLWTHYLNSIMRKNWKGCPQKDLRKILAFMFCCLLTAYNTGQRRDLRPQTVQNSVWPWVLQGLLSRQEKPGPSSRSGAQDKGQQSLGQAAESRGRQCALQKTVVLSTSPWHLIAVRKQCPLIVNSYYTVYLCGKHLT